MNFHDEETEYEIIGAMLTQKQAYLDVFDVITHDDFETPGLGTCFNLISEAFREEKNVTVAGLAKITGIPTDRLLGATFDADINMLFIKAKAKNIRTLANKRRVFTNMRQLIAQIEMMEPIEISTKLAEIGAMVSYSADTKQVFSGSEMNARVVAIQKERFEAPGLLRGILTQYYQLDQMLRGLRPKRMTVIAAGTGFGKTTLALNLFDRIAEQNRGALFVSNENDADDNLDRLCAMGAGLNLQDVESGHNYRPVCLSFSERYKGKNVYLSDNSPRTVDEIVVTMQRHVMQHQIEVVFVDYIGEISGDALKNEAEEAKLARYTQRMLDATKQLGVHLILLVQLNRQGNMKGRPSKTELAGCFRIAQKAHCLILFWQDEAKNDIITIEKNRQGPAHVDIKVEYDRSKQFISECGLWDDTAKDIIRIDRNPQHFQNNDYDEGLPI